MDIYPESEPWQERLKIQKAHDEVMDKIGRTFSNKNIKNNGENKSIINK